MADSMQFWGVEVKPNQAVKCEAGEDKLLHLSMAALGESKKANENVVVCVTFDKQKLVIGTLSSEKCAQISYDLVFEKEFELSHSSKNASVYFTGYTMVDPTVDEISSDSDDDSESEEKEEVDGGEELVKSNGEKVERKSKIMALKKAKAEQIADDEEDSDDDDDYDEEEEKDDDSDDNGSDDEDMVKAEEDSDDLDNEDDGHEDDDDDDNSEEDDETPKKAAKGMKRKMQAEPVTKAAVSEKKAKLATPTDGKKGGDAKKDSPAKSGKKYSGGSVICKACSKTFKSEKALESHTKAKHASK